MYHKQKYTLFIAFLVHKRYDILRRGVLYVYPVSSSGGGVIRRNLGRRLVNLLPVAQRTNALTLSAYLCCTRIVRAGPAKKRTMFPKALAPPLSRVRTWKLDALTLTQQCTCKKSILSFCFPDSISPRCPRKLENTNFSKLNSYKIRRSRSIWNLETMLKTRREYLYKFHCPIRHPSRYITNTRFHM